MNRKGLAISFKKLVEQLFATHTHNRTPRCSTMRTGLLQIHIHSNSKGGETRVTRAYVTTYNFQTEHPHINKHFKWNSNNIQLKEGAYNYAIESRFYIGSTVTCLCVCLCVYLTRAKCVESRCISATHSTSWNSNSNSNSHISKVKTKRDFTVHIVIFGHAHYVATSKVVASIRFNRRQRLRPQNYPDTTAANTD